MRMAALLMAMIALLGSPQGEGTVSETTWETVAVQVLEETPETAARTLLDWAGSGQTIPEEDVVLALLEEMEAEPAASAVAFAAVLDRADSLRKAGEAPELGEETYRAAVRSLSPFFTRLLGTETTLWQEEPSAWPADLPERHLSGGNPLPGLLWGNGLFCPAAGPRRHGLVSVVGDRYPRIRRFLRAADLLCLRSGGGPFLVQYPGPEV